MKETALEAAFKNIEVSAGKRPNKTASQILRSLERRERVRKSVARKGRVPKL